MSLVRITIFVESVSSILCDYDSIQIWRSETKHGTYSEITNMNSRIRLCENQSFYDYDDKDGSEYFWYKWRYSKTNGPVSRYLEPTQAHVPNATYCGIEDVKRHLRTKDYQRTIRFSDAYKNLRQGDPNQGVNLAAVNFSQEYSGIQPFIITFTDATNFKLEVDDETAMEKRLLGIGDIGNDFTSNDGSVYINDGDWSGTPAADEEILFESDSHISIDHVIRFINDAEVLIDVILEANLGYEESKDQELRFNREDVPKAINKAASRFAAFLIYTTIYSEQSISGLPNNINDITDAVYNRNDDLASWSKQAMKYLQAYIKKYTEQFDPNTGEGVRTAPAWITMDSIIDGVGVVNEGEGLKFPEQDLFFERSKMSYKGLLDWDLLNRSFGAFSGVE